MRQVLQVLRGCFATYLATLLVLILLEVPIHANDPRPVFDFGQTVSLFVIYGGVLALMISIFVVLIWAILAARKTTVSFWAAPITGVLIFLPLLGYGSGITGALLGLFLGIAVGGFFWFWAFGARSPVQMRFRN